MVVAYQYLIVQPTLTKAVTTILGTRICSIITHSIGSIVVEVAMTTIGKEELKRSSVSCPKWHCCAHYSLHNYYKTSYFFVDELSQQCTYNFLMYVSSFILTFSQSDYGRI